MKKRMTTMIIALLVVFGGLIVYNVVKNAMRNYFVSHYKPPAVTVSTVFAKKRDWNPIYSSVGNFVAINGVDVNTQSGGKVRGIHFASGEEVEKGTLLIDIDDSVEQATLKYNQADLSLQTINYKRQRDLLKRNATAVSSVDEAKARMLEAQATLESTQASIDLKHIKAPFSGVLGIREIDLGQFVQPGTTSIVTLQSLDPIYLNFFVPEQYSSFVNINQTIEFTMEQNPGILFSGKITAINSKIDSDTHTLEIQATIANCPSMSPEKLPHSKLIKSSKKLSKDQYLVSCDTSMNQTNKIKEFNFIPGMFAAISIVQPPIHDVIVLPTTAISYTMYGDSVFIVEKHKDDTHTVKRAFITTGEARGNYAMITKGLKVNQEVVAVGEMKLQDGTQVVINNKTPLGDHSDIDSLGQ